MTIGADALVDFFGTQDTVSAGGGTSAVSDAAYSAAADMDEWTNDDDAPFAAAVLTFQYPSGTIDTNGIHLYVQLKDIDSTDDEPQPDSGWDNHYIGSFPTDSGLAATTDQATSLGFQFDLPNHYTSQKYEFAIKNDCGVQMTAGWTLKITPVTKGPHA